MKRILSLCLLLLTIVAAQAQDTKYTVTLNVPDDGTLQAYAGIKSGNYISRRSEFAAGEEVHLTGSLKSEYSCTGWTDESGTLVCDSLHYIFTMPAHDVTLTGHTTYDPANPPGPREDGYTDTWHRLYLRSNPEFGGAFTWGLGAEAAQNWLVYAGYVFTVQAYPATGFKFAGWQLDGQIVSTDNPYTFTMPDRDMTLYAMYDYDPETPASPHGNMWNKESGELIMSEFTPGKLQDKVVEATRRDPWHSDWELIKSAIVDGPCQADIDGEYGYSADWNAFRGATNVEYLDYSRTSGLTKVPRYWSDYSMATLKTLVLPSTLTTIDVYAFRGCKALADITCFATTPPVFLGTIPDEKDSGMGHGDEPWSDEVNWAFNSLNPDNIVVRVPAESVPLYQEARGWREFMILPITQQVSRITVSLPQATDYEDMFLELVNSKTGQKQRYVVTKATSYTFNNIIHKTTHNLYLKNKSGAVLASIDGIDMVDKDVQVSFADLKTPIDVTLQLMSPDGSQVADGFSVTWTDRQGNFLTTGPTLAGQLEGAQVRYRVKLDETLARQYQQPQDSLVTVGSLSIIHCPLSIHPQVALTGTVTSESTGSPVRGATVTVSQLLNGAYTVTQTAKTDAGGHYEMTVYEAPTTLTVTHSDYLKASQTIDNCQLSTVNSQLSTVNCQLSDLTGTIIDLDLYYRPSVHDGEESVSEAFGNPGNVTYSVYDETHQRDITGFVEQYPRLVLAGQSLDEGTLLRVTASSKTNAFMPVTAVCTVDSTGRTTAILGITELGRIEASFETTDNMSVMALLYDGDGQLKGWSTYDGTLLTLSNLPDGRYTLVTMGSNSLFNASNTYEALQQTGVLEQNAVVNQLTLSSGHIAVVQNQSIPLFDEDAFRMTSDAATLSANKSEVSVGQYVTLRAKVAFKPAYAALTDVQLQFDLPEGCSLVEHSVMVGNSTADYQQDGQRITVPLANTADDVRFCVVPTKGGSFQVAASVVAGSGNTTATQPFATAVFKATDLSITVVETTARRSVPVTGMAVPLSLVQVYDNGTLVGETTSLGTGYWNLMCPLDKPYNLSEHTIYAVVTTPEGLDIQSESKTVKVNRGGLTPVVSCRLQSDNFEHKHFDFKWDFRTNEVTPTFAPLTTAAFNDCQQTFEVNFYDENDMVANDTTVIRDVTLYVKTSRGDIRTYPLNYSVRHKSWWIHLDWHDRLPVNVDLDYTVAADLAFDRQEFDDRMQEFVDFMEEGRQHMLNVYHMYDDDGEYSDRQLVEELGVLLDKDSLDASSELRVNELVERLVGDSLMNEARKKYEYDYTEINRLFAKDDLTEGELDRLHDLVTARAEQLAAWPVKEINVDSIAAVYQRLDETLAAIYDEVRDSMLMASAMFYSPDTAVVALPNGDASVLLQSGVDRYEKIDIQTLTQIDHEQLVAKGYEVIPTLDGTPFYYLQTENGYELIDAKTMKHYTLTLVDGETALALRRDNNWWAALMNLSVSVFFPKHCGDALDDFQRHFVKAAAQLKQSTDFVSFLENLTTNAVPLLKDAEGILKCVYDNGYAKFDEFIKKMFDSAQKKANDALKKAETELQGIKKDMADLAARKAEVERSVKSLDMDDDLQRAIKNRHQPGSPQWLKADNKIKANGYLRSGHNSHIKELKNSLNKLKTPLDKAKRSVEKAGAGLTKCLKNQKWILGIIENFPIKLVPDKNVLKTIPKPWFAMPLAGTLLKCFPACCVAADNLMDSGLWIELHRAIESVMPCEGDAAKAAKLQADKNSKMMLHLGLNFFQMGLDFASLALETTTMFSPMWFIAKTMDVASCVIAVFHPEASQKDRTALERRLHELDCKPKDKDEDKDKDKQYASSGTLDDNPANSNTLGAAHRRFRFNNVYYIFDPAGYVYEAVNSNRVEGVQTTCYYKEEREDMYGDIHEEVVLWDAEQYAQENPLFTDADGRYRWDVPTGLWQVKYEKEGYETTYSDWLPVPPPQLEVNVGITQLRQPNVAQVRAFEDGIDITFDKYMRPHTLTGAVSVTKDGQLVAGTIELLNAESGYQTPDSVYASRARFVPLATNSSPLLAGQKVQLTVKRSVESYAGIPMEQDFTQAFTVGQRIMALTADTLINMQEGREVVLTVRAEPASAAKGKQVVVTTSDAEVVSLSTAEPLVLDEQGAASVTLTSKGQGVGFVNFTMVDDADLSAATLVLVRDSSAMQVAAPQASRLNGITLYKGSEIALTSSTAKATILYTLDGSCPCDAGSASVHIYTAPIVLDGDSILIRAMAVAPGMEDSRVVEYRYKGVERPVVGVESLTASDGGDGSKPAAYFRLDGRRAATPQRGLNIVRYGSGRVRKVVVR